MNDNEEAKRAKAFREKILGTGELKVIEDRILILFRDNTDILSVNTLFILQDLIAKEIAKRSIDEFFEDQS